jgi:hypothetical protein
MTLFSKILVLFVFIGLMTGFIYYFNESEPDIKYVAMENLQKRFAQSVTNSHWQWQAEGRPQMIILIHYEPRLDDQDQLVEKDRRPVAMGLNGYPKAEHSSEGCAKIWQMILNMPLEINGFKVFAEFFEDSDPSDRVSDAKCRFRLSVGPSFDYHLETGLVSPIEN